jgi:hypothetical protein
MRIARTSAYLPRQLAADGDQTILSAPSLLPSGTFLTQYLAREIMPRGEVPASRWSYRDTVYRLGAQLTEAAAGQLALDA